MKPYRAFTESFTRHMQVHGWPKEDVLEKWVRQETGGCSHDDLVKVRRGEAVPERYTCALISYLLRNRYVPAAKRACEALESYLRERGFTSLDRAEEHLVAAHVCEPVQDDAPDTRLYKDYFLKPVEAFQTAVTDSMERRYVRGIRKGDSNTLRQALEWMYVQVARVTTTSGPVLETDDAISVAAERMKITIDEYVTRATMWHKANPWTIVLARHGSNAVGMSIVLPVTRAAYEAVANGERATYECSDEDILEFSPYLIFEALSERPHVQRDLRVNPTFAMRLAIGVQAAALSRASAYKKATTLRWLSFAGTPNNQDRHLDNSWKPLGKTMHRTGLHLFGRTLTIGQTSGPGFFDKMFLSFFGSIAETPAVEEDELAAS